MKRTWRFWGALWVSKGISWLLRLLGKKGTTLPGRVALKIHPQIIRDLASEYQEGIVIVTGTNGKTTTANLLANILRTAGKHFAFNQAGANLVTGITGALLFNMNWRGRAKVQLALLEVDEATVPKLCEQVKPDVAIITNFFRDQLDRYGELDTTVKLVKNSLPMKTDLILNADDPLVAQFGIDRQHTLYFGVDRTPESKTQSTETREARFCPQCGAPLEYRLFHYGQLGIYNCPECDFARPKVQVLAEDVHSEEADLKFKVGVTEYTLGLQGYYNLYNALAAITAAKRLGIREQEIERGIRQFIPQAGRMERFLLPRGKITLTLVKNPTGFNQVLQTVFNTEAKQVRLLIIINDLAADGRDISWLWDVQFEILGEHSDRVQEIFCSGLRAEDMALRLKYAGVPVEKLRIEHTLETAVDQLQAAATGEEPTFICPTYTALFPVREILEKRALKEEIHARRDKSED
ncbi:MurT ligase domain-containing protein [Desulfitobacterium sp.]|uniref:MurT ligase domain-containing protein n=1 Tax=Desulfitobacterium sp. TaxID=49981 RepID=UPI002CB24E4A|nr:MurT ligase domain-containing protein [Desulfitobacterium sp.]HVJ48024.1 MurT ligase domain-containing protein [Desulfitobacterium sp.]